MLIETNDDYVTRLLVMIVSTGEVSTIHHADVTTYGQKAISVFCVLYLYFVIS